MCFNLWRNLDVVQVYDRSCNNSGYPYFPQWARVCADRIANICNQTKDCRAILLSSGSLRSTLHWFCLKKVAKHDIDPFYHLRLPAIYTTLWSASVRFTPLPTQHVQAHCGLHTHTNPPWSAAVSMEFWNWKLAPLDFSVLAWNLGDLQQNKNSFFVYSCFFIFPHGWKMWGMSKSFCWKLLQLFFFEGLTKSGHLAGKQNDDMGYTEGAVCWQRSNN